MSILKCKMCGGTMEIDAKQSVAVCQYCGTRQTLPRLDSERVAGLYERAELLRRGNDFDKAAAVYEQIVSLAPNDAEAYWSLVLCRYGIEYVEDPASHKRVPTINRVQFGSILEDTDYLSALQNADEEQKSVYIAEAKAIEAIQKGYLAISEREKPFDVFICYKETDDNGRRTMDSVLANDLYHQLTQEGFKVFFSRITLEDKLGTEYEPYIFAALNSAKVMVVLGTRPEYFSAVWVRNEWSRFLALIKNGEQKVLIPAYRDMSPYDLPEEFSHLQALDMSRLGFMQDLIRGIKKILGTESVAGTASVATSPLLRRAFLFLENREWKNAESYCDRILDQEPENAQAYVCKLMAELQVSDRADLRKHAAALPKNNTYRLALRYADAALKEELESYAVLPAPKKRKKEKTEKPKPVKKPEAQTNSRLKEQLPMVAAVLALVVLTVVGGVTSKKQASVPDEPPASLSAPVSEPQEMTEEVTAQDTEPEEPEAQEEPIAPEEDAVEPDMEETPEEAVEEAVEETPVQPQEETPAAAEEKPTPEQPKQETPAAQPEQPKQEAPTKTTEQAKPAEEKTEAQPNRVEESNGRYYIYEYDAVGRIIKATLYEANGDYRGDYENVYDASGLLSRQIFHNKDDYTRIYIYENGHLMKIAYGETEDATSYSLYEYDENWVIQRTLFYENGKLRAITHYVDGKADYWEDLLHPSNSHNY